jgi:hypothetical protein
MACSFRSPEHRRAAGFRPTLLAALLTALLAVPIEAQSVRTLEPGTRVRVRLEEAHSNVVAILIDARPDTIVLARPSMSIESRLLFPLERVSRLEISAGRRQLAPIGAVGGFLLGTVLVAAYNSILQSQCFGDCPEPTPALAGGLIGGVAGGVAFYFVPAERWVEVALPNRRSAPR